MSRETHVLIDEQNQPVLSGTIKEMIELANELRALGFDQIKIRRVEEITKGNDND